ncbi:MAG: mechanosensitive ion channel domain-containing protein [Alkalispirochaeta sp.]
MLFERWYQFSDTIPVPSWLPSWSTAFVLPLAVLAAYAVLSRIVPYFVPRERRESILLLFRRTRFPVQVILLVLVVEGVTRPMISNEPILEILDFAVPLVVVAGAAMVLYRAVGAFFTALRKRFEIDTPDNLRARQVTTQIMVLERVVGVVIVIITIAVGLMTIPGVRQWGASLLASAGVIGLVVGFAAQQTIANVFAGIQIAVTQPVRIDDAVVIDGEWGRVEEITLTYIVVRVWDKRRLVVPISYLLQKPFQNWTRNTSSIIGSVYLYADYTVDVDALRLEQSRVLAASELWDGEVDVIQVTDATEQTVQLRCLMSAANSPQAWDLRCLVREHLIGVLQSSQPAALPRQRMRLQGTMTRR